MKASNLSLVIWLCALVAAPLSCKDDDDGSEATGQSCEAVDQCYRGLDQEELSGDVVCMDRVEGGYCTHFCVTDADCCAVPGECRTEFPQVCGPFESTGQRFCFLSCEDVDDGEDYCSRYAHPSFNCRSTGGGSENRKVCVP